MHQRRLRSFIAVATALTLGMAVGKAMAEPASPASAAAPDEAALALAWKSTRWPADMAERADAYLQRFPASSQATAMTWIRDAARRTADLIERNDVRLYRTSFDASYPVAGETPAAVEAAEDDVRRAALGDADAAWRIALRCQAQPQRRLGWLQLAELLGHGRAAYELALHYRRGEQPLQAARHEAQAQTLGYGPPSALDQLRK